MKSDISWNDIDLDNRRFAEDEVVVDCIERKFNALKRHIPQDIKLLEIGAGEGFWTNVLKQHYDVLATDASSVMLERNKHDKKEILELPRIPKEDNAFDIVFESNVLHHVDDDKLTAKELVRVARDYVVVVEPNRNNPLTIALGVILKHERKSLRFSKSYVKSLFEDENVKLVDCFSHGCLPPNKSPRWFWRIFKYIDISIPFLGLDNIFIFKKVSVDE